MLSLTKSRKKRTVILSSLLILGIFCFFLFASPSQKGDICVLNNNGKISALDKEEKAMLQLQNTLQKTINSLDEISDSSVTINTGTEKQRPSASVLVKLSSGKELTPEQQSSIKKFIKNSVHNLSEDDVLLSIDNTNLQ